MRSFILVLLLVFGVQSAYAVSFDIGKEIENKLVTYKTTAQRGFDTISNNFGNMAIYRSVKAPRPMGSLIGIDVGVDGSFYDISQINTELKNFGLEDIGVDSVPVPKLQAHATLPFGLGVRAFALPLPEDALGIQYFGASASYAVLNGDIGFIIEATYTLAVTGHFTKLKIDKFLDIDTQGADVVALIGIDLPLLKINPYVGMGYIMGTSTALFDQVIIDAIGLKPTELNMIRTYVGAEVKLSLFIVAVEMDTMGDFATTSAKFGMGFGF